MRLINFFVFFMFALSASTQTRVGEAKLNMQHVGHHGNHSEYFLPADAPDVYYDSDGLEITIVADGFCSYYNVVIIRNTPYQVVITTQVSGYGDVIDVSALSSGSYTIVITSEFLNEYEGQFTI